MKYFVTAIGTDSGKTLTSAILTAALKANYWKPVQAGAPTDTDTLKAWLSDHPVTFFNEAYFLKQPASPHQAAAEEGIDLKIEDIKIPESQRPLVIEGAGGLMAPLNDREFMIDLALYCEAEIVLVADLYLGSINHTLLSVEMLKKRGCKVKGIVFNGPQNKASEALILKYSQYPLLLRIKPEAVIDRNVINRYALELIKSWLRPSTGN